MSYKHLKTDTDLVKRWKINPFCHWCGTETILRREKEARVEKSIFDKTVSKDHINSRYSLKRYEPGGQEWVLSCHECNMKRNKEVLKLLPADFKRKQRNGGTEVKTGRAAAEALASLGVEVA